MSSLINVEEVKPGMVLAAPIMNRYGQILLNSGIELMPKHSRLFKTWGIKVITIKNESSENDIIENNDLRNEAKIKFENRLLWQPETPIEHNLYEVSLNKAVKDLISKFSHEKSE